MARKDTGRKEKRCKVCNTMFQPQRMGQKVCSVPCSREYAKSDIERKAKREARKAKDETRKARNALRPRSYWMKEAQKSFNRWVRKRDEGKPCICCEEEPKKEDALGGLWDAGHYRSVGAAPHLRFNPDNCHGQRKYCNRNKSGNAVEYRLGLIQRIGLERVEALEHDQSSPKWSIDDLKAIKSEYDAKYRELMKREV